LLAGGSSVRDRVRAMFAAKRRRHWPVVSHGCLRGVIAIGDIQRWMAQGSFLN
jgi:hypothetical protein